MSSGQKEPLNLNNVSYASTSEDVFMHGGFRGLGHSKIFIFGHEHNHSWMKHRIEFQYFLRKFTEIFFIHIHFIFELNGRRNWIFSNTRTSKRNLYYWKRFTYKIASSSKEYSILNNYVVLSSLFCGQCSYMKIFLNKLYQKKEVHWKLDVYLWLIFSSEHSVIYFG